MIDREKLRQNRQTTWFILDVLMIVLVVINLGWILFDTLYMTAPMQAMIEALSPAFNQFYEQRVHERFWFYDLIFVTIFLTEFVFQWIMAMMRRTYARWYFYPFAHWYDLLGCIPISSFRMLRLLRLFSLVYRLQKMGLIDLTRTRVYKFIEFYFNAFIDEVSDRVVIRVLDDIKHELTHDNPVAREIMTEVIAPRRQELVAHLSKRLGDIGERHYDQNREVIRNYLETLVTEAVHNNRQVGALGRIPVLGRAVVNTLEQSINEIVYQVFDQVIRDFSSADNNRLVDEIVDVLFDVVLEQQPELDNVGTMMTVDAIELIKKRVRVQAWKQALRQGSNTARDTGDDNGD